MLAWPASRRMVMNRQGRHDAGAAGGADLGAVFVEVHVADPVQAVLDGPVAADDGGELGDAYAWRMAAGMMRDAGRAEEAITWLRSRADAGDTSATRLAARMMREAGRADEAIIFYQRAAEAGDAHAVELAAEMMQKVGRSDEAARLRRYGIEPGGRTADPWKANIQG